MTQIKPLQVGVSIGIGIGIGIVALIAGGFFCVLPVAVDAHLNRVYPDQHASAKSNANVSATALHRRLLVADLHADTLLWDRDLDQRNTRGHIDIPRLIEGNVALQMFTIVTKTPRNLNIEKNSGDSDNVTLLALAERWPHAGWSSLAERALYQAHKLEQAARFSDGRMTLIRSAADLDVYLLRRSHEPGITAAMLGVEGAHALDGRLDNIDRFYDAGIRMMAPTHFVDNDIGGSVHGVEKTGLTDKGRDMIRRMEAKHMLLDLAHASPRTMDDALAMATRPLVISHTGVKGTCDNTRNLTDAQLRAVAHNGGVIGIGYWETAVCGKDAAAVARAILYAVRVAGIEHVGLGSDFDGAVAMPFDTAGLSLVTDALLKAGMSERDIGLVMGGNTLRLLHQALPER